MAGTETAATASASAEQVPFSVWIAHTQVVDDTGRPMVVYHGTRRQFDDFDPELSRHFGIHLGSLEQAEQFGKPIALYASIRNPIRLPDLGTWHFELMAQHLDRRGLRIIDADDYERAWNARDQSGELRKILLERGFDGVVYANLVEGEGDSFIAFRGDQLRRVHTSPTLEASPVARLSKPRRPRP